MYEKIICAGLAKVLYATSLKWTDMKDKKIHFLLASVPNPTSWPTFFSDAAGTAIQQELIANGLFCPGLPQKFKQYASKDGNKAKSWNQLDQFMINHTRTLNVDF